FRCSPARSRWRRWPAPGGRGPSCVQRPAGCATACPAASRARCAGRRRDRADQPRRQPSDLRAPLRARQRQGGRAWGTSLPRRAPERGVRSRDRGRRRQRAQLRPLPDRREPGGRGRAGAAPARQRDAGGGERTGADRGRGGRRRSPTRAGRRLRRRRGVARAVHGARPGRGARRVAARRPARRRAALLRARRLAPPRRRSPRARPRRDAVAAAGRWRPPRARHHRRDPARGLPDRDLPALRLRPERARPADRARRRRRPQIGGTVVTSVFLTVTSVLLTVLGGAACIALMGAAIWLLPRLARRSRLLRRVAARLRSRTPIERIVSWVEAEQPDLRRASAPDGTVTLLFSDIEGSSRLTERLGDDRWMDLLGIHNTIVRAQLDEHGGYEVKSQGDGFMVAFPTARQAVMCA